MKFALIASMLLCVGPVIAQDEAPKEGFTLKSESALQLNQIALSNWASGGENSLSLNANIFAEADHRRGRRFSQLIANWQIGIFKEEDEPIQKSADHLTLIAVSGYHVSPKLSVGVLADLTTQVAPSYEFDPGFVGLFGGNPTDGIKIGDFMSPGYIEGGAGLRYVNTKPAMELIFTPLSVKETIILDEGVRAIDAALPSGLYGNNGDKVRTKIGMSLRMRNKVPIAKNVAADSYIKAFVPYGESDIDISWVLKITGQINKYLSADLHTTILFDKDVDTDLSEDGKQEEVQIREVLGIGLTYAFQL
jgi:hypothetical protein